MDLLLHISIMGIGAHGWLERHDGRSRGTLLGVVGLQPVHLFAMLNDARNLDLLLSRHCSDARGELEPSLTEEGYSPAGLAVYYGALEAFEVLRRHNHLYPNQHHQDDWEVLNARTREVRALYKATNRKVRRERFWLALEGQDSDRFCHPIGFRNLCVDSCLLVGIPAMDHASARTVVVSSLKDLHIYNIAMSRVTRSDTLSLVAIEFDHENLLRAQDVLCKISEIPALRHIS